MNAVTVPKSDRMNRFEGFALIAMLQGFPLFASTVLLLKLLGSHQIVSERYGAAIFVALATLVYAWVTPVLVRKFPNCSGTATSRRSSMPACRFPGRSHNGGRNRKRRRNCWRP
jgi:hypothetical protein